MKRYQLRVAIVEIDDEGNDGHRAASWYIGETTTDLDTLSDIAESNFDRMALDFGSRIPAPTIGALMPEVVPEFDDEERFLRMVESSGGDPWLSGLYGDPYAGA